MDFYNDRSTNGIDFETIGKITTANCNQSFRYTDKTSYTIKNYYRLHIIENGQVSGYSPIVMVETGKSGLQLSVLSSFIKSSEIQVGVTAENTQNLLLLLTDMTGHTILRQELTVSPGSQVLTVYTNHLASGIYWLYGIAKDGRTNLLHFIKQ